MAVAAIPARDVENERVQEVLTLIVAYREAVMPAFERFVEASNNIEAWLESGGQTDAQAVRNVGPHVYDALVAVSLINFGARQVTSTAAHVRDGLQPQLDARELN